MIPVCRLSNELTIEQTRSWLVEPKLGLTQILVGCHNFRLSLHGEAVETWYMEMMEFWNNGPREKCQA
jgi:hypothetical protein